MLIVYHAPFIYIYSNFFKSCIISKENQFRYFDENGIAMDKRSFNEINS